MTDDAKVVKWVKWLTRIEANITHLLLKKHIFWEVQDIINKNDEIQKPSYFYQFLGDVYSDSVLMGIRKQTKIDKDSISMARLLKELGDNVGLLTRERYVNLYREEERERAHQYFEEYGGKDGDCVDVKIIEDDLEELKKRLRVCEGFADRQVAHSDSNRPTKVPTFREMDDCVEHLHGLFQKYSLMVLAGGYVDGSMLPNLGDGWRDIFRTAWIREGN